MFLVRTTLPAVVLLFSSDDLLRFASFPGDYSSPLPSVQVIPQSWDYKQYLRNTYLMYNPPVSVEPITAMHAGSRKNSFYPEILESLPSPHQSQVAGQKLFVCLIDLLLGSLQASKVNLLPAFLPFLGRKRRQVTLFAQLFFLFFFLFFFLGISTSII